MTETSKAGAAPAGGATGVTTGAYRELAALVRERDLLRRRPGTYAVQAAAVVLGLVLTVGAMVTWQESWWLLLLAPVLAVLATQSGFLGHDIGHLQVTRHRTRSAVLGLLAGNLLSGLSFGWWVRKHNAHHAHPNDLEHDPDVRVGVLVFDPDQASTRRGLAGWTSRHQAALFFPLLLGEAFALHVSSVRALLAPQVRHRWAEAALLAAHAVGYVALLALTLSWAQAVAFVAIHKGLQGLYLGCAFAPNHKGMPSLTAEQAQDPLLRQVLTSRNIRGGPVVDVVLGGLNYQIEHHLFPSMPRANLRLAQPLVRDFCAARAIPYAECGAVASYAAALRHLHAVGAGLRGEVRSARG